MDAAHDLEALAKRVEAAVGPDRELDAVIAATLRVGTEFGWADSYPAWEARSDGRVYLEKGGPSFSAPAYSKSLDAAMSLVPKGCQWLRKCPRTMTVYVPPIGDKEWSQHIHAHGETPALALTAASLRALSQGVNDDHA